MNLNIESSAIQKKQAFAINNLLPFYVTQMETAQWDKNRKSLITERMAKMDIFPYITANGTKYGKMSEPGISWYYCKEGKNAKAISTESYKIIDSKKFNQALFDKIKFFFTEYGYLHEFSDKVVLENLIEKMGKEENYTEIWWKYAIDAFQLWDKKSDLGTQFTGATKNINNSFFLFDDKYCEPEFRELLERNQIYKDIRRVSGYKTYIASNLGAKEDSKIAFLKYLGVPSSFIKKERFNIWTADSRIVELFKTIGKCQFPVQPSNVLHYNLCRLSEYVFTVIFKSDWYAAKNMMEDDEAGKGIVVRNVDDAYMSRHCSLFYVDDFDRQKYDQSRLNQLLIKPGIYAQDMLEKLAYNVREINAFDDYEFSGLNIKKLDFYRWAWQFTTNKGLLESILDYCNRIGRAEKYQDFLLDVLDQACGIKYDEAGEFESINPFIKIKNPLTFNMEVDSKNIIKHYHTINSLYEEEKCDVSFSINDAHLIKDVPDLKGIKKRIVDAVRNVVPKKASEIEQSDFWRKIHWLDSYLPMVNTYGMYVHLHHKDFRRKIDRSIILLVKHQDRGSYLTAISRYIADVYGIILNDITLDWKEAYAELAEGVDKFLSDKNQAIKTDDYISFPISYMDDVSTLNEETRIWNRLKNEYGLIKKNSVSETHFEKWNEFLNDKYHGRCQLCGKRTVTGPSRYHFWTYRIVKGHDNILANMNSNLLCLCPKCHGELSYGYKGRDLTDIKIKAKEYVEQLEICLEEDIDDLETTDSIISDFSDQLNDYGEFHKPVVCDVVVNGETYKMKFSWEHFMQIAFLLKQAQ